jgi:hypothetical protein
VNFLWEDMAAAFTEPKLGRPSFLEVPILLSSSLVSAYAFTAPVRKIRSARGLFPFGALVREYLSVEFTGARCRPLAPLWRFGRSGAREGPQEPGAPGPTVQFVVVPALVAVGRPMSAAKTAISNHQARCR